MKIFDCHSDTMADIRNRVFAGEHDVIRNRHLPLYDKGGVSGLLYAIYLDADLGDPQRTMLEILRTSFAEFDAVQDRLAIGYTAGDLARIMDGGRTASARSRTGFTRSITWASATPCSPGARTTPLPPARPTRGPATA